MFRGGGAGGGAGGAQMFEAVLALVGAPSDALLRMVVGLLLIAIILTLLWRLPVAPPRSGRRSTTCLICTRPLTERVYVDRYIPGWVACADCYGALQPRQQRQYRAE